MSSPSHNRSNSITAMDFIESQTRLEEEARTLLPYNPDHCTFHDGSIRQQLFVCLSCKQKNKKQNAICYSCSIQCHSDHDLIELFTKRGFSCDCGTDRMASFGGCNLRKNFGSLDQSEPTNVYGQNFDGKFCSCSSPYDPLKEQGVMFQCHFGAECNEDWYHEECILGIPRGSVDRRNNNNTKPKTKISHPEGVNMLDSLEPATSDNVKRPEEMESEADAGENDDYDDEDETLEGLPSQSEFESFVCWRCINKHRSVFDKIKLLIAAALDPVIHGSFSSISDRKERLSSDETEAPNSVSGDSGDIKFEDEEPATKKVKLESTETPATPSTHPEEYSLFLKEGFQDVLNNSTDDDIKKFITRYPFFAQEEEVYEPEQDEDANSSLLDAGTRALNSIPREQAINGLHAYEHIRSRLSSFLRPFAEQGKVVTESDVASFFDKVKEDQEKSKAF